MFFFRKLNIKSHLSQPDLQEIFKTELVGVHETIEDGFFSKRKQTYELANDFGKFLLHAKNETRSNSITVFSVIGFQSIDENSTDIVVTSKFTSLTNLIIAFIYLILISVLLFAPNVRFSRGMGWDISGNYTARVLVLGSFLLVITLLLWWKHNSSSKRLEKALTEILSTEKIL